MKTLIVTYTPRQENSNTQKLVDSFKENIGNKSEIEVLNLLEDRPETFDEISTIAYGMRNYMNMELDEEKRKSLEKFDRFTAQFKSSDVVVLAFPMYNFGLPGIVKSYLDMVMLKGETWDMDASGYKGFMTGKKLLTIFTSAGVYNEEMGNNSWDNASHFMHIASQFLGFEDSKIISAQGTNRPNKEEIMEFTKNELKELASKWY